jgi:hypothetical protein
MNEDQHKQNNLLDTTDCLEAVGVFKGWKNFLFIITILCLLLLQAFFWLVDVGYVKTGEAENTSPAVVAETPKKAVEAAQQPADETAKIQEAAKKIAAGPNQPIKAAPEEPQQPEPQQAEPRFGIKFEHLSWLIRFLNFVLILSAALYCLTMLFSLKVSLLGRLGGINHIARAFFLSLVFVVLLLPWQRFFGGVVVGAMYTPAELLSSSAVAGAAGIFEAMLYYLRFTGYWVLVMLFLIFAQIRSSRWARAILRRLEVI